MYNGNFFENLGTGYEIKLNTEYWSKFINILLSIESLLALLENNFEDDIEIFSRISNVGLKAMMRSKNLFNNIIINGWTTWAKVLH